MGTELMISLIISEITCISYVKSVSLLRKSSNFLVLRHTLYIYTCTCSLIVCITTYSGLLSVICETHASSAAETAMTSSTTDM